MVQFISRNPVTATMQANEARNLQVDQINESRALRQEQRDQVTQRNELNSGLGRIFSEEQAAPVPVPDNLGGGPPAPSPIRSFGDKTREAIKLAAASPVGGETALRLAQEGQKRKDAAQLEILKATQAGDYDAVKLVAEQNGIDMSGVLNNPKAQNIGTRIARSIPKEVDGMQALAYQNAGSAAWAKRFSETGDYSEADLAAGEAGMKAAMAAPVPAKQFFTDDKGNVTGVDKYGRPIQPAPVRGKSARPAGGGAGGDRMKGAKFDKDENGFRIILYRDGSKIYPKDAAGNPVMIPVGVDEDKKFIRELTKAYAGKAFAPPEDPVGEARRLAAETSGRGGVPAARQPSAPARLRFDAQGNPVK